MRPVLFRVGGITVYSYGFMLFWAFLVGILVASRELKGRGYDPAAIYPVALAAVVGGIAGARLFYLLGHWEEVSGNWRVVLDPSTGGLVFYGGLALAVPLSLWANRRTGVPAAVMADSVALTLPLSLAVARVGCFLNGCCGGKPSGLPWAVTFPGTSTPVHPTQLYEMVMDLALFGLLLSVRRRLKAGWSTFLLFLSGYGLVRFLVEFFRYHPVKGGAFFFQSLSLVLLAGGAILLVVRERAVRRREP
jgi:phosphatidylglycerol:prolipoprotein diacylglycerol transferase